MTHADLARWIDAYERAWRTPGTAALDDLFTADASYSPGPFTPPIDGRPAIAAFWEGERESAEERFTLSWERVAIEDAVGVVRVEVRYAGPPRRTYRDLWIVRLNETGQCVAFEEWPFHPGQSHVYDGG